MSKLFLVVVVLFFIYMNSVLAKESTLEQQDLDNFKKIEAQAKLGETDSQIKYFETVISHPKQLGQFAQQAYEFLLSAGNKGHLEANFLLGYLYVNGIWIKKDLNVGLFFLQKSSDKGLDKAQFLMGITYLELSYLSKDTELEDAYRKQSIIWLKKAHKKGHVEATAYLGTVLTYKENTRNKGLSLLKAAISKDSSYAMFSLGLHYKILWDHGRNDIDFQKATKWLSKAASLGDEDASEMLATLKTKD